MAASSFGFQGYLVRFIAALVLVFLTYNPSGKSYFHWARDSLSSIDPLVVLAGVVLLIGWVIFIRATLRSLGAIGLILATALFGTLVWLVVDRGWLSPDNVDVMIYIALFILSAILATGMSWSHIRRRLTGQVDVDDVEQVD